MGEYETICERKSVLYLSGAFVCWNEPCILKSNFGICQPGPFSKCFCVYVTNGFILNWSAIVGDAAVVSQLQCNP